MSLATASATPVVATEALQVTYQRGAEPALTDVSLSLLPGEGLLVTGDHGSGKSTLLRAVLGLVRFAGEVHVAGAYPGTPPATRWTGYGPQGKGFALGWTPRQVVHLAARLRLGSAAGSGMVDTALKGAGIPPQAADRITTDVEQLRRVSLASAIVGNPALVVLDDPWEFQETLDAVVSIRARGGTVIVATHDPGSFAALLGRTLALVDGVPQ